MGDRLGVMLAMRCARAACGEHGPREVRDATG